MGRLRLAFSLAPFLRGEQSRSPTMAQTMAGSDVSAARVAAILTAAEEAAERIRLDAEAKMQARIAEGDRAAENRVRAAEKEAQEIVAAARAEADSIRGEAE